MVRKPMINTLYNHTIRPFLPRKIGIYNGVCVRKPRLFDRKDVFPEYESDSIAALKNSVKQSDKVGIIGGGYGVTATVAASKSNYPVIVYEASPDIANLILETSDLNGVDIGVIKSAVGPVKNVFGKRPHTFIKPSNLPYYDVLEIDAEGSEIEILNQLEIKPRVIIVEYHTHIQAPYKAVNSVLEKHGYETTLIGEKNENIGTIKAVLL